MDDYELLDLGAGARLERFGDRVVDRPHPAAYGERADPAAWDETTLFYVPGEGWHGRAPVEPWTIGVRDLTIELRPTDTGQVGVFPEQEPSWTWLDRVIREQAEAGTSPTVLNLFAYTGVATLVAAAAGAKVTHVDAAKSAVAWARRNAELSRLEDRPVRWLVDDVAGFVARELRRGRRYDGVVLDPPSYGHGARGRGWRFEDDLPSLLADCARLAGAPDGFVLFTGHTPGFGPDALAGVLGETWRVVPRRIEAGDLAITARSGRQLELGAFARWAGGA
jgi:23S rRNA (cytosine1962-C5)-methyltransferase